MACLAQRVFITHAASGSKTEAFALQLAASGKPLITLDSPANANLMELGGRGGGNGQRHMYVMEACADGP